MHIESWVLNKRGEENIDIETPESACKKITRV